MHCYCINSATPVSSCLRPCPIPCFIPPSGFRDTEEVSSPRFTDELTRPGEMRQCGGGSWESAMGFLRDALRPCAGCWVLGAGWGRRSRRCLRFGYGAWCLWCWCPRQEEDQPSEKAAGGGWGAGRDRIPRARVSPPRGSPQPPGPPPPAPGGLSEGLGGSSLPLGPLRTRGPSHPAASLLSQRPSRQGA